jgi:hypothetical protein
LKTPDEFAEAMKERRPYSPKRPEGDFVVSAARDSKQTNVYWPEIKNSEQAVQASNMGFGAALFVAAVNALISTISVLQHAAIFGVSAAGYVDASLFALIAWGIRCRSRVAAVAGLSLFLLEKIYQFATQPKAVLGLLMAAALLALFISGVRGTFAYHRFSSAVAPDGAHD